ncbi:MAG: exodeoxyribonuclease III [bacterium]|nr:exodeoxyribonuclease III [bacterium]
MRIISWNVNGIRSIHNKGLFVPFVEKEKPDIICLQETKAEEHQSAIDLPDYEEYWNSAKKKGYSGTAIFCKDKPLSVRLGFPEEILQKYKMHGDGYGDPNAEGRVITAEFGPSASWRSGFFVVNVYTPNSKPDLSRLALRQKSWDPAFLAYVKWLENPDALLFGHGSGPRPKRRGKPVIICGDLNVAHTEDDLANPKANEGEHGFTKEERAGIDAIISAGFIDTFRNFTKGNGHYTWWSHFANARARNIGWRLDYIFVSSGLKENLKSARIMPDVLGSDHCPVELEISV